MDTSGGGGEVTAMCFDVRLGDSEHMVIADCV